MPELPEVETTRRGLEPHVQGRTVDAVQVWQPRLRWDVPDNLHGTLKGERFIAVERRAKYLLLRTARGTLIVHLGMSGSLRLGPNSVPHHLHDRVGWTLNDGQAMRLRDPRRFGAVLWTNGPIEEHWLLRKLGPEPLEGEFTAQHLYERSRGRRVAIKAFLMDSHVVAGVGNIYACEALHAAGIHPTRAAGNISLSRYATLVEHVRDILGAAIRSGGTTLRDYVSIGGETGDFRFKLSVYGREGEPCHSCAAPLKGKVITGRSTVYCATCQR
ncbi:MAG: bifunctional DNA-formamidopyrimidine glycosylase/DNA-(apurinic or apyrimidinic site) lyase [Gammaproteobacteria bacterium]|nr:bifunctional DNA-formamidopyrimidine glycosylase/DNA-(apurinic or apyrimidinic site) lyase [Gammaproteobacteria bacterium]